MGRSRGGVRESWGEGVKGDNGGNPQQNVNHTDSQYRTSIAGVAYGLVDLASWPPLRGKQHGNKRRIKTARKRS